MKFEVSRELFSEALQKVDRVAQKNASLPILGTILIEAHKKGITLKSTNGELGVIIECPAVVQEEGRIAPIGSVITSYLQTLQNEKKVVFEAVNGNLLVTSSRGSTTIKCLSTEDFPSIPESKGNTAFSMKAQDFVNGCNAVAFCAAQSSIKPELSSVYMYADSDVVFVATDSFRLAEKRISLKHAVHDWSVLIPGKNIVDIVRILQDLGDEIEITIDAHQISIKKDGIYITSRVVNGSFPDYRQIIPKEAKTTVVALKQDVINSCKAAAIFADKFNKLTFSADAEAKQFFCAMNNSDVGQSRQRIEATVTGDSVEINFNYKYVTEGFSPISATSLQFEFNGVNKLLIRGYRDQTYLYLVMPMNR